VTRTVDHAEPTTRAAPDRFRFRFRMRHRRRQRRTGLLQSVGQAGSVCGWPGDQPPQKAHMWLMNTQM